MICANVGDSRCVIGAGNAKHNAAISLTEDHKPSIPEESARISAAGGFVMYDRVNGELAMSRAIGDFRYKNDPSINDDSQYQVICYPDVAVHSRSGKCDQMLVLACDGVFDVLNNSEVGLHSMRHTMCAVPCRAVVSLSDCFV